MCFILIQSLILQSLRHCLQDQTEQKGETKGTTADANAVGRRLSETSTTVDAKIFVDSEADAEAAALALNDANPSSASAFDGLNVESYEASAAPAVPPLPVANIIIIAAIAVILALFLCINVRSAPRSASHSFSARTTSPPA